MAEAIYMIIVILVLLFLILPGYGYLVVGPGRRLVSRVSSRIDPPEVRILRDATDEFEQTRDPRVLLSIGDLYRRGAFPRFRPSPQAALACYRRAAELGLREDAQSRAAVALAAPEDRAPDGLDLPTGFAKRVVSLETRPANDVRNDIQNDIQNDIRNDMQNVHDHAVVKGIGTALASMVTHADADDAVTEVRAALLDAPGLSASEKSDALLVLESLSSEEHSTLNVSEQSALARVYRHIPKTPDPAAAMEILGKQLASAVEHGHVVCSTGKIARMVAAMDGLSDDASAPVIKPMWAVKEELATMAARMRDEGENRAAYEQKAHQTYVVELGFSEAVVGPLIESMAKGFDDQEDI